MISYLTDLLSFDTVRVELSCFVVSEHYNCVHIFGESNCTSFVILGNVIRIPYELAN